MSHPRMADDVIGNGEPLAASAAAILKGVAESGKDPEVMSSRGGVDLVFSDLHVDMGAAEILHGVGGNVKKGQMLAVMGPSGAGKSTLLSSLSGRLPLKSGSITFNGQPLNKQLKRRLCYVLQQDLFYASLTLRQTLKYTAMLRLPDKMSFKKKMERVDRIVEELDLNKCLDTIMGGMFVPGLSGGEKKRANIACELLTDPSLMLIDEPTSGLDSAIAYNLMTTLKGYSEKSNKTVVTTIHQPSSAIFHMFDSLLLLTDGKVAYFGPGSKILDFFSSVGLTCTPHYNPADFILEKVKESKQTTTRIIESYEEIRQRHRSENHSIKEDMASESNNCNLSSKDTNGHINNAFLPDTQTSAPDVLLCNKIEGLSYIKRDPDTISVEIDTKQHASTTTVFDTLCDSNQKWPTGWWTQYTTLTQRSFVLSRGRIFSKLNVIQNVTLLVIVAMLWFRLPRTEQTVNDRLGLLFFCTVYWSFFFMFDTLITLPQNRPIMKRERDSGAYRISAYYCAMMTSELPLTVLWPIMFFGTVIGICNLNYDWRAIVLGLVVPSMTTVASQSFGIFLGTLTPDVQTGIVAGAVVMLGSMLAGGYYTRNIPIYFGWIKYGSFITYSFHSHVYIELSYGPLNYTCLPVNQTQYGQCLLPTNGNRTEQYISGLDIIEHQNLDLPFWVNIAVLGAFPVVFRYLGYITLRFYDPNGPPKRSSCCSQR